MTAITRFPPRFQPVTLSAVARLWLVPALLRRRPACCSTPASTGQSACAALSYYIAPMKSHAALDDTGNARNNAGVLARTRDIMRSDFNMPYPQITASSARLIATVRSSIQYLRENNKANQAALTTETDK